MLCLGRYMDEWIDIDGGISAGGISICVVDIRTQKGGKLQVRVGVDAPRHVRIDRREVAELRKQTQESA